MAVLPRQSRIDAPGALHHVIIRGIERKAIFKDDADHTEFIELLASIGIRCVPASAKGAPIKELVK